LLVTAAKTADFIKRAASAGASPAKKRSCKFKVLAEIAAAGRTAEKLAGTADFERKGQKPFP
jgi:hypothetical protein